MLLGRDAEVATLDRLAARARLGRAGVLALLGEPGAGKSTVLEHTAARLEGSFRVLRAAGAAAESEVAFAGLSQLLGDSLDVLDELPAPQALALGSALAVRDAVPGDRLAVGAATLGVLTRCAEARPVAVLVDDVQLLDRPSAEALLFAGRRLRADRVAMVLAGRSPEADEQLAGLPTLRMAGLEHAAARAVVERAVGGPVANERFDELYERSAGNPLALVELATHPHPPWPEVPGLPSTVPETITRAFAQRVRRLPAPAQHVLLVASVAGGDLATTAAASRRLGLDPADLGPAEDAGLVVVGDRITFRHPLLQSVAYSGAGAAERRAAHRAVADALPDADVDRRAWHLAEAAWGPDAATAALLDDAARRAVDRSGYAVASTAYERAAALSVTADDRRGRLLRAARAAWSAGDPPLATRLLDHLDAQQPRADAALAALELRAAVASRTGSLRRAVEMFREAADRMPTADDRARVLADAVHASLLLGSTVVLLELADELARLLPRTGPRARALALTGCGIARVLAGRGGAAELRAAVPLLEADTALLADPHQWPWLMMAPLFLRDAAGGAGLRRRVEEVRRSAPVGALSAVLFYVARDQATTDAWGRAQANYSLAIDLARESGATTELAVALAGRCWLAARQGDADRCLADAAEARDLCADADMHLPEAWLLFARGDLALAGGDARGALEAFSALGTLLEEHGMEDVDLAPVPEEVEARLRAGEEAGLRERVAAYLEAADAKGQPWARARARRALGMIADDDVVDATFAAALALHGQTLDAFETARTLLAFGERLRRAGRRVDARPPLRQALAAFEHLGADRWAGRAATELAATGESVRRSADGWRAALTPQELQVSMLLADGHTTREAAAALFLSPKTVEYHLRKVYTKLGVHSREELAAAMADAEASATR
jgi:DNA-binding CsgD family transcriptional regulator